MIAASTGSLLLGAYDTAKFRGDLKMLPMQVDLLTISPERFDLPQVVWTSLSIQDANNTVSVVDDKLPDTIVLDAGSTFTYVPIYMIFAFQERFDAIYNDNLTLFVPCDLGLGTLEVGLGGPDGLPFEPTTSFVYSTKPQASVIASTATSTGAEPVPHAR